MPEETLEERSPEVGTDNWRGMWEAASVVKITASRFSGNGLALLGKQTEQIGWGETMGALQVRQGSLDLNGPTMHCLYLNEGVTGPRRVRKGCGLVGRRPKAGRLEGRLQAARLSCKQRLASRMGRDKAKFLSRPWRAAEQ